MYIFMIGQITLDTIKISNKNIHSLCLPSVVILERFFFLDKLFGKLFCLLFRIEKSK